MWKIYIDPKFDSERIRYAVRTLIYHIGVNPIDGNINVYIGISAPNKESEVAIEFCDELLGDDRETERNLKYQVSMLEEIGDGLTLEYEKNMTVDKNGRILYSSLTGDMKQRMKSRFIDNYSDKIRQKLSEVLYNSSILFDDSTPWSNKTIILSHDVDDLYGKSWVRYAFWLTKGIRRVRSQFNRIYWWMSQSVDPYFSPLEMVKIENEHGFTSSFYFMAKSSYLSIDEGRRYNVTSKRVKRLINQIESLGAEVGFHPSRITFDSSEKLKRELNSLSHSGACIDGVRRHYLTGTYPQVWREIEKLNLVYDTSVGWPDSFGTRSGTCRPFKTFDYEGDKELDLYEMPLTFMDGTLKYESDEDYLTKYYQIESELLSSGVMTFLWHTDRFCNEINSPNWKDIYIAILKHWSEKQYRVISTKQFIEEYIAHERKFKIEFCHEYN